MRYPKTTCRATTLVGKFEKVSFDNFKECILDFIAENKDYEDLNDDEAIQRIYDDIQLPVRATKGSAGYDLRTPVYIKLLPGQTIKIPTGIRVKMNEDWVLMVFPRSGLGFKYRLQLDNTVGVIDSDYYYSDNEGHIFAKLTNDTNKAKEVELNAGDAFAQCIFMPYGITEDDDVTATRNGGFGSTGR